MKDYRIAKGLPEPQPGGRGGRGAGGAYAEWIAHVKGGPPSQGNFLNAANCSEAIALAGAAMRYNRKIFNENKCAPALMWDRENMKFSNVAEPNQYLTRDYREGWKLTSA
jgi:hypothetical protein